MALWNKGNKEPFAESAANENTASKVYVSFDNLLHKTQSHMAETYGERLFELDRTTIENYIRQYIQSEKIYVKEGSADRSLSDLVSALYGEMAEYSVITPYLKRDDVEEININAWNDIQIIPSHGETYKLKDSFRSPEHAFDTVRRLLRNSKSLLDSSRPISTGFIGKNIRVTAISNDIVGSEAGVAASIRIVNAKKLTKEDFFRNGTCTVDMYDFLSTCFIGGISECFAGETGSGKTTIMADIMSNYPINRRLITIEKSVREFDLVKRDEHGKVINNVLHLVTRESDDKNKCVTMNDLLTTSLTMDPDAICVAEMKNEEAWAAQEAARTGHAVLTTTHAGSAHGVYTRLATLCLQAYSNIPYDVIIRLVCEAFPIAIYQHKLDDGVRRVTEIAECIYNDGDYKTIPIYKYQISRKYKDTDTGKYVIEGDFVKKNNISNGLRNRLLQNGVDEITLNRFIS